MTPDEVTTLARFETEMLEHHGAVIAERVMLERAVEGFALAGWGDDVPEPTPEQWIALARLAELREAHKAHEAFPEKDWWRQ